MAKKRQPQRKQHVPMRTCVICREKTDKRQLTRIVLNESDLFLDLTGKMNGRGAYLCSKEDCWQGEATPQRLASALKITLTEKKRASLATVLSRRNEVVT